MSYMKDHISWREHTFREEIGCRLSRENKQEEMTTLSNSKEEDRSPYASGRTIVSLITKVQHMIEKCLIFHMTKEECMEALKKHAKIEPVITSTVWKELEKENKEFFDAYSQSQNKSDRMSESETDEMIQKMISDHQSKSSNADQSKDSND